MKLVVVLVAVLLLVWLLLGSSRRRGKAARDKQPARKQTTEVEGMVACARCGVHLPASQALQVRGQAYCSAAHRDAGAPEP